MSSDLNAHIPFIGMKSLCELHACACVQKLTKHAEFSHRRSHFKFELHSLLKLKHKREELHVVSVWLRGNTNPTLLCTWCKHN